MTDAPRWATEKYEELQAADNIKGVGFSLRWARFVERYFQKPAVLFVKYDGRNRSSALLTNYFENSFFGKKIHVAGAFLDHGGLIPESTDQDLFCEASTAAKFTFLTKRRANEGARHSQSILEIPNSFDTFMAGLPSRTKRDIKRATRFEVSVSQSSDYRPFYRLYCDTMRRYGTPPHSRRFFLALLNEFDKDLSFFYARRNGIVISASCALFSSATAHHLYAANNQLGRDTGTGDLLLMQEVARCVDYGVSELWLGRSIRDSGVENYKKKWRPRLECVEVVKIKGASEEIVNLRRGRLSKAWAALPAPVVSLIGPEIRKFIP